MIIQIKKLKDGNIELKNKIGDTIAVLTPRQAQTLSDVIKAATR